MNTNRLIQEKSPYLLQHAHNPVDWYPWSDEAFARAIAESKPVFLSIGYSTCHWCHVMERESFEDQEVARQLNETFINIKVDREERPDIDSVYMAVCQMLTGSGGWPLTILMTPEKKPFFAGTYLPKNSRLGRLGLMELCQQVRHLWVHEKQKVQLSAKGIVDNLGQAFTFKSAQDLDEFVLDKAYKQIGKGFDADFGGFESAPKFPMPHRLLFLLRYYHKTGNTVALEMVRNTLLAMRLGGIWDHIGFGFHRYSTDRMWLVPHFEKMLYDQALLAIAYLEMFQITKDPFFATTAEEIFTYVLRDMTSDEGAFFAAEDADSEGEEGKFYVWSTRSFRRVLGQVESSLWEKIFNIKEQGNFLEEATGQKTGANIPHLKKSLSQWEKDLGMQKDELLRRWEVVQKKLFSNREKRIPPFKDDKILTDWNGLMIAALALGARLLGRPEYTISAQRAAAFICTKMQNGRKRLRHRFRAGDVAIEAHANDYAFVITGILNLYAATFDPAYLETAVALQECMLSDFWDNEGGGFFLTTNAMDDLPVRPKELYDGALPSANSVSLLNLLYLFKLTGDVKWEHRASELSQAFAATVSDRPWAYTYFLLGIDFVVGQGKEIVIAGEIDETDTKAMLSVINQNFGPHTVALVKSEHHAEKLSEISPFTAEMKPLKEKATAFVCNGFSCSQPVTDLKMFKKLTEKK